MTGDTVQFYFKSDSSVSYYGYYAVIKGTGNTASVTSGTYSEPSDGVEDDEFNGWYANADLSGDAVDPATVRTNTTLYAKYGNAVLGTGTSGSCSWAVKKNGTLVIGEDGKECTMINEKVFITGLGYSCPWVKDYQNEVTSVKFAGIVHAPQDSGFLFANLNKAQALI